MRIYESAGVRIRENEVWIYFRSPDRTQHLKLTLSVNSELTTLHAHAVCPQ